MLSVIPVIPSREFHCENSVLKAENDELKSFDRNHFVFPPLQSHLSAIFAHKQRTHRAPVSALLLLANLPRNAFECAEEDDFSLDLRIVLLVAKNNMSSSSVIHTFLKKLCL